MLAGNGGFTNQGCAEETGICPRSVATKTLGGPKLNLHFSQRINYPDFADFRDPENQSK